MILGYARVSTGDQAAGLAAQERDLLAAGAERIISEQVSSVAFRPGLTECLAALQSGDVLMVTKPDRLARSTAHLLSIVEDLDKRGVGLVLLSMGGERLDTRNPTAKLILTILAGVATWEREAMLERQREGIAKARVEGKYKGRKTGIDYAVARQLATELGATSAARELNCHVNSIWRAIRAGRDEGIPPASKKIQPSEMYEPIDASFEAVMAWAAAEAPDLRFKDWGDLRHVNARRDRMGLPWFKRSFNRSLLDRASRSAA